jgi:DNA polymerase III psi subunit
VVLPQNLGGLVDLKVYIPALKSWFRREWQRLNSQPPAPGRGLLMGCPLWGDDYIDRFFYFCLPSIREPKSLEALQANGCRLVIYTDDASFERFWVMKRALRKIGIDVEVHVIPQEIMDQVPDKPLNKYWLLGTVQQLLIQEAADSHMGFHALHPDHLYCEGYFANLFNLALENDCIAQTSISANIEACLPELEQWRCTEEGTGKGALSIPAADLGDMGWRHLHGQTRYNLMNAVDMSKGMMPKSHFQCWQGKDKLYLYCCHMNAVWMAPEVCREAPVRLHNALDTELPFFMTPNAVVCVPDASDGMTFIELSDDAKWGGGELVPFGEFAYQCWSTVHYRDDWMPFFRVANEVPIKPQAEYLDEAEIQKRQNSIVQALIQVKPAIMKYVEAEAAQQDALKAEATVKCDVETEVPTPIMSTPEAMEARA